MLLKFTPFRLLQNGSLLIAILALPIACRDDVGTGVLTKAENRSLRTLVAGATVGIIPEGQTIVLAVNELGYAAGLVERPICEDGAFVWHVSGSYRCLPRLEGTAASWATSINDEGVVAGVSSWYDQALGRWSPVATLWRDDMAIRIGTLPAPYDYMSYAWGINNEGHVVGESCTNPQPVGGFHHCRPFLWRDGNIIGLPLLPGGDRGSARGINNVGTIVGYSQGADRGQAVVWENLQIQDLGSGPSAAYAINDSGVVAGAVCPERCHAVVWRGGAMHNLSPHLTDGSSAIALAINNRGWVVGAMWPPSGDAYEEMGFVWTPHGGFQNLRPTTGIIEARGINDAGLVVGMTSWDQPVASAAHQLVLPPATQIAVLVDDVEEMIAAGEIPTNQVSSLLAKLSTVESALDREQIQAAINVLNAFINQVTAAMESGRLVPLDAQRLIDAARSAITGLESR